MGEFAEPCLRSYGTISDLYWGLPKDDILSNPPHTELEFDWIRPTSQRISERGIDFADVWWLSSTPPGKGQKTAANYGETRYTCSPKVMADLPRHPSPNAARLLDNLARKAHKRSNGRYEQVKHAAGLVYGRPYQKNRRQLVLSRADRLEASCPMDLYAS